MMKENIILDKTYNFSIRIVRLYKFLSEKNEYILSKQILRCGTSIGANTEEAIGGISEKDFVAKLFVAYKEARETHYWLRLLKDTNYIEEELFNSLIEDCDEILKILYKIIKSTQDNIKIKNDAKS